MYSVSINDISDIEIDKISNPQRPLVEQTVNPREMKDVSFLFLLLALLGSWSIGFFHFFLCLVCLSSSYIYSMPPMRLKRLPIVATFILSIACLATILFGFFFLSALKNVSAFPALAALAILVLFTLESNFKDMKDVKGDPKDNVKTLPVIFGENGPRIVAITFASSFLLAPILLSFYTLYITAIPAALLGYKFITRKPYNEKLVFLIHFGFIASIFILVFLINYAGCKLNIQCIL